MADIVERLEALSVVPTEDAAFDEWLKGQDALAFLEANAVEEDIVLHASFEFGFIHAVSVPTALLDPPDVADLLEWNFGPSSGWGVCYAAGDSPPVYITPPLDHTMSKTIDQGEQLVYVREFDGRLGGRNYYEVLQKLVHVAGLHFVPERSAYCRLDRHGDVEDAIRIIDPEAQTGERSGTTVITCKRDVLEEWLALTDSALVRMFDFTRVRWANFNGWGVLPEPTVINSSPTLFYRAVSQPRRAGYVRGCQIIQTDVTRADLYDRFWGGAKESRSYASFIAHDFRNRVVREISCAPGATANYFIESDLPFEMSPVFFRPEVLLKYKADSDKYRMDGHSVSCRGTWHLQTYHTNDAGQIQTYIVYLRSLPHEEQLHWRAHNEAPKAPISETAYKTDFEGSWDLSYDPLPSLKGSLAEISRRGEPWWTLRSEALPDRVHYPATAAADEWANEIMNLDQLVVEGFEERWLRQRAESLGRQPPAHARSLKLVEECLMGLGFEENHAKEITAPLHRVHELRSKLRGHAAGSTATEIKRTTLKQFGSYHRHFRDLCAECDKAIEKIVQALSLTTPDRASAGTRRTKAPPQESTRQP